MYLLTFVGGFILGMMVCEAWGNHRKKYYKKQLIIAAEQVQKVIAMSDKLNAANKLLIGEIKMQKMYRQSEEVEQMKAGLARAIKEY